MKIALVHNRYAVPAQGSGEEIMVEAVQNLLEEHGHLVLPYIRSSLELQNMRLGNTRAFFSGIYNFNEKRRMTAFLARERPDLVFVQNVFPLLSPSILVACRNFIVPVVMRCPNYRLLCPSGLFMSNGQICERCTGGKEYWCILKNCEQDIFKSMGYALRNYVARQFSLIKNNVDVFMVLTPFAKQKLVENGFPSEHIYVLSALADPKMFQTMATTVTDPYIGFVGRISREKGIDTLIEAARNLSHIPFKVAGRYDPASDLVQMAPKNVEFLGHLERDQLNQFYQGASTIVIPSRCYEGLPVVLAEAMLSATPTICSRLGGLPSIVEDGVTGLMFQHNNVEDLRHKIALLWSNPDLCHRLGQAGKKKAEAVYSPEAFYCRLMEAFEMSFALQIRKTIPA